MRACLYFAGGCVALLGGLASAQNPAGIAKTLQGDYVVPEAPALTMLSVDASKLLRPSSVQQLTSNLASSSGNLSFIPSAFAVEASPAMLLSGDRLRLDQYRDNRFLYRTRISVAASRDSVSKRSQFASAIRFVLQDNSDLRTNAAFVKAIEQLTYMRADSEKLVHDSLSIAHVQRVASLRSESDSLQAAAIEKAIGARIHGSGEQFTQAIAAVKRAKENAQWNADVFDVAFGIKGSSTDSTGKGSRADGFSGWATKGWAVAGDFTQLLLGMRGSYERDSTQVMRGVGDATARIYVGSNHAKASFEGQATGRASAAPSWLLRTGAELEVGGSFWIGLSAGWNAIGGAPWRYTNSIKFQLAPPNL